MSNRFSMAGVAALSVIALPGLHGCTGPKPPVELGFDVRYGNSNISCTDAADGIQLSDLRFYVHDVVLRDVSGKSAGFRMTNDGRWQNGVVALIDLENGQGTCLNGSPEVNASIRGTYNGGPVRSIAFNLGVPAADNHLDPMTARPPLNYTAMHWHWLTGYKFMRAGVVTENDGFFLHLGSGLCDGTPGDFKCKLPNRPAVTVSAFDPARHRIILDIKKLFEAIDLTDKRSADCSSGPDQDDCGGPLRVLGLDPENPRDVQLGTFYSEPYR